MSTATAAPPLTLRQLRERKGYSPSQIERFTGGAVKKGALSAMEQGKVLNPGIGTVIRLAEVLEVDVVACHTAIAASVAERADGTPRKRGRPAHDLGAIEPAPTFRGVIDAARELLASLERLSDTIAAGR